MSRAQREKSQFRAAATGKTSVAWLDGNKRDSERSSGKRRRRGLHDQIRHMEKYIDFFE
jgi:hypothetical protein